MTSVVEFCGESRACVQEFVSAGAVCFIKEGSGRQNQYVHIVLKVSKSADAKGDVPNICGFMQPAVTVIMHSLESI